MAANATLKREQLKHQYLLIMLSIWDQDLCTNIPLVKLYNRYPILLHDQTIPDQQTFQHALYFLYTKKKPEWIMFP